MKQGILKTALLVSVIIMIRCSDEEKVKTIPEVTTAEITDFTTTTATVGGEITDDGNAEVTVTGVVYSSTVAMPTIDNDKIELTDTEGEFSAVLADLSSGTTYHVRAYATNSKGTGYGEVIDFTTGNAAPEATTLSVTGTVKVAEVVTAAYTYVDAEGDVQGPSTFKWYRADNAGGTNETTIAGETAATYLLKDADEGKFIRFEVIPIAVTGNITGEAVQSGLVGPVAEQTTVTFMYNGASVTYGIIKSTASGTTRKWLDRNLGAPSVPTAVDNYQNYGDLFQWGRLADGHQQITRVGPNDADASGVTGTTSTVSPWEFSTVDVPNHNKFIVTNGAGATDGENDWRKPTNDNLWQGVNGISNPCPSGWRIPTQAEWTAEGITSMIDGYTKLKLTYTGVRTTTNEFFQHLTTGNYWSSTISPTQTQSAMRIRFTTSFAALNYGRANAIGCRCIKD